MSGGGESRTALLVSVPVLIVVGVSVVVAAMFLARAGSPLFGVALLVLGIVVTVMGAIGAVVLVRTRL